MHKLKETLEKHDKLFKDYFQQVLENSQDQSVKTEVDFKWGLPYCSIAIKNQKDNYNQHITIHFSLIEKDYNIVSKAYIEKDGVQTPEDSTVSRVLIEYIIEKTVEISNNLLPLGKEEEVQSAEPASSGVELINESELIDIDDSGKVVLQETKKNIVEGEEN